MDDDFEVADGRGTPVQDEHEYASDNEAGSSWQKNESRPLNSGSESDNDGEDRRGSERHAQDHDSEDDEGDSPPVSPENDAPNDGSHPASPDDAASGGSPPASPDNDADNVGSPLASPDDVGAGSDSNGPASPDDNVGSGPQSPAGDVPHSPDSSGELDNTLSPASPPPEEETSVQGYGSGALADGPPSPTSSLGSLGLTGDRQSLPSSVHSDDEAARDGTAADSRASSPTGSVVEPRGSASPAESSTGEGARSPIDERSDKESAPRRVRIASSSSDEGDSRQVRKVAAAKKVHSDDEDDDTPVKPRKAILSSDSEDSNLEAFKEEDGQKKKKNTAAAGSDDDDEDDDKESVENDLMAHIFGGSDEDEEFEGFAESEVKPRPGDEDDEGAVDNDEEEGEERATKGQAASDGEDTDEKESSHKKKNRPDFVSDFDVMMQKKKEEQASRRRKRKNVDIINDNDDLIVDLIKKMKEAADGDRVLNESKQPAIRKLKLLSSVLQQLNKAELQAAFLDCGALGAITEWLAPLPDKSLPHVQVREGLLKILSMFPTPSSDMLKSSGTGKAVMYLYKHPRETRKNKEIAGKLINEWSRPIFGHATKYMSKDEREQRDYQQMPKRRKSSTGDGGSASKDIGGADGAEQTAPLRPGDSGWVSRARVPMPSTRDYVVRPKWNVEEVPQKSAKKGLSRYEKQKRMQQEKKKVTKQQRAVTISIEGRNMAL